MDSFGFRSWYDFYFNILVPGNCRPDHRGQLVVLSAGKNQFTFLTLHRTKARKIPNRFIMKITNILALVLLQMFIQAAIADSTQSLPGKIREAAEAYKTIGVQAFIPTLLKNSPLAGDKSVFGQVNSLIQIESFYGAYLNSEHIKTIALTKSTRISYFILNYERGPAYGVATLYRSRKGEIVTQFNVHISIQQIIPDHVMSDLN